MTSRKQIARALARRLARARDRRKEARWLALTIDRLIYASNQRKLNMQDKEELADLICEILCDGHSAGNIPQEEAFALTDFMKNFWSREK